jgi:UDP-galactopyranose mutase
MKVLVVGSGISGLVAARLMRDAGHDVVVLETREHIGGNCYDYKDAPTGVTVHKYGPHCLHTNSDTVALFLQRFGKFNDFSPEVWGRIGDGRLVPVPFNLHGADLVGPKTPEEIRDMIFVDYSEKMWGRPWEQIPENIRKRLPVMRESHELRFHQTKYVGVPVDGWTSLLSAMAEGVTVHLNTILGEWISWSRNWADLTIYTGKLDAFYGYRHGRLPYRSLDIKIERTTRQRHFQINECNSFNKWTRACDQGWWYGKHEDATIVTREYSVDHTPENEPYYPMRPFSGATEMWEKYDALAKHESRTVFLGRLANYTYIDMGVAVGTVLGKVGKITGVA